MLVIGLTGSLGTGKSTVAAMFAGRGIRIIDADAITRDLLAPGKKCVKKVAKIFPGVILNKSTGAINGARAIDRSQLAKIVFDNPRELQKLTDILYPEALKVVKSQISRFKHEPFVVLDAPLLFESGWDKITDTTVVVKAKRRQQLARARKRLPAPKLQWGPAPKLQWGPAPKLQWGPSPKFQWGPSPKLQWGGMTQSDFSRRLKNQMPLKQKCDLADIIIDNSRGLTQTRKQVDAIIHRLKQRK